jgi:hypothetical protein
VPSMLASAICSRGQRRSRILPLDSSQYGNQAPAERRAY